MEILETLGGDKIAFNPTTITVIVKLTKGSGVYGLGLSEPTEIAESVEDFLARLSLANKFAQATRPDGASILVNAASVKTICSPLPGEYDQSVQSVISCGGTRHGVKEPLSELVGKVNVCLSKNA